MCLCGFKMIYFIRKFGLFDVFLLLWLLKFDYLFKSKNVDRD